jgi:ParB-like chromosome segregation protein Spo0J
VEEALVVREMIRGGLTGVEVGILLGRHKSWVSRRLGLVERLAPELQEEMKLGLLDPGVARRLLSLPRGNQVELAAVARQADLGARDTEKLVGMWRKADSDEVRRYVLAQPKKALAASRWTTPPSPPDPRLSSQEQAVQSQLKRALKAMGLLTQTLRDGLSDEAMEILKEDIEDFRNQLKTVSCRLGLGVASAS